MKRFDRALLVSLMLVACGVQGSGVTLESVTGVGTGGDDAGPGDVPTAADASAPGEAGTTSADDTSEQALTISQPTMSSSVPQVLLTGDTVTAWVVFRNNTTTSVTLNRALIAGRPPGATHAGGPYADLSPQLGTTTLAPGATVSVRASRQFVPTDKSGTWEIYGVSVDSAGRWQEGASTFFEYDGNPGALTIASPLTLNRSEVSAGVTLTASVTYKNTGGAPVTVGSIYITSRPPGGTHADGPRYHLSPNLGATTLAAGASTTLTASRTFQSGDPTGTWEIYSTYQDASGGWDDGPSKWFTVTSGTSSGGTSIVEPGAIPAGAVSFEVRADRDVRGISPLIYGINQVRDLNGSQKGTRLVRLGGNRWTAYNWENNASNAGVDYYHQNDNYLTLGLSNQTAPGEAVRAPTAGALNTGASVIATVPIQGYVAADTWGGGDVAQTSSYLSTRFRRTYARKSGTLSLTPNLGDGAVYQDEFVYWLTQKFPSAFSSSTPRILFSLDNEPDLWSETHSRIQPTPVTASALIQKNVQFAGAIKDIVPNAKVLGFVSYGWAGYTTLQGQYTSGNFLDHYLTQMRLASEGAERRLLDVLDLHWYPEAQGDGQRIIGGGTSAGVAAARMQAPRSLWDPNYRETSWIASSIGGPIRLIPLVRSKIDARYPGTKLGFTEYFYGGGGHISGAIAQADVLGIFGREGVYLANLWEIGSDMAMTYAGMRAFTSYDGGSGRFGNTSVRAQTTDVAGTSVYASIESANTKRMVIVAINKTGSAKTSSLRIAGYGAYTAADVYRVTSASSNVVPAGSIGAAARNAFSYTMPAYSVSVIVPR